MQLDNKTIVLTGASSGIGLDLLRHLVQRNTVIALARREPVLDGLLAGSRLAFVQTDLADGHSVAAAIRQIRERWPDGIDGLINCAAVQNVPQFISPDFDPARITPEIAVNLTSPIELVAGLLDRLQSRPQAFIFNVNSGLGLVPKSESAVYCATKAGLDNFTRGLRAQLGDGSVNVQQVFLPLVDTAMTRGRGSGKLSPEVVARQILAQIESGAADNDIGKVWLLRLLNRLSPAVARRIMQKGAS